jgi:hypothetical protein
MQELDLGGDLTYSERPIKNLDTTERVTHNKVIKMCKVQWSRHTKMKLPRSMKKSSEQITPSYFQARLNLEGETPSKWGRFVRPTFCNNKILSNQICIMLHFK